MVRKTFAAWIALVAGAILWMIPLGTNLEPIEGPAQRVTRSWGVLSWVETVTHRDSNVIVDFFFDGQALLISLAVSLLLVCAVAWLWRKPGARRVNGALPAA